MAIEKFQLMDIKGTIWGTFGYLYEYRKPFTKALLIPIALLILLGSIPMEDTGTAMVALLTIVLFLIYTILAITTHRIILLGPDSVPEWGVYVPRKREFYFVLYSVGFSLVMLPFGLLTLIPAVGWIIAVVAIIYMMARLSLVFPAIATDQGWSFSDSWEVTKNHQILMIVVVGIFPFVVSIPERLLSYVPYTELFVNLLSSITMVIVVAALSVVFKVIGEDKREI